MTTPQQITIFDTTLRDGQQCPGAGMSFVDNLKYARMASELGIDVLEAGFPSASKMDFDIVHTIATEIPKTGSKMVIAGLCQLRELQIDKTIEALTPAIPFKQARLHTYVPVAEELLIASLGDKADKQEITKNLFTFVKKAVDAGCEVEFSPEGYSRMGKNFDWVTELIFAAIEAGATTINCPDTIGGAHYFEGENYFVEHIKQHAKLVAEKFPNKQITWSCHNHNDFGTAVENSIHAVFEGPVRQIECTINGLGERAGNASLEQCVMIIKHFAHLRDAKNPLFTNIKTEKLQEISDFIAEKMLPRQPHFPVTGANAAKHTSGGHTNAILKNPLAYQPFDPKEVGNEITFVFGPLSGGNHAKDIIEKAGYICYDNEKADIAQFIKNMYADRRKGITDQELMESYFAYRAPIVIEGFNYSRSANQSGIELQGKFFSEQNIKEQSIGKDSALSALKKAIDKHFPGTEIQDYSSQAVGEGIHASSLSIILLKDKQSHIFEGQGQDEDIEISAMKALIDATNRAYIEQKFKI